MATNLHIDKFSPNQETVPTFLARIENKLLSANLHLPIFDSLATADFSKFLNFIQPLEANELSLEQIQLNLGRCFAQPREREHQSQARSNFSKMEQWSGESVSDFLIRLKEAAGPCSFGSNYDREHPVEARIRDQFLAGVRHRQCRLQLLQPATITLDQAVDIAANHEAASNCVYQAPNPAAPELNRVAVRRRSNLPTSSGCFRCGSQDANHDRRNCFAKTIQCNWCSLTGHLERVCNAKKNGKPRTNAVHQLSQSTAAEDPFDDTNEFNVVTNDTPVSPPKVMVPVSINGVNLQLEFDTGSPITVISRTVWEVSLGSPSLAPLPTTYRSFSGHPVDLLGCFVATVTHLNQTVQFPVAVASRDTKGLVGRDLMSRLQIDWKTIGNQLSNSQLTPDIASLSTPDKYWKSEFPTLFDDTLGHLHRFRADLRLHLPEGEQIKFHRPRPLPYAIWPQVKQEIERQINCGILEPTNDAPFGAAPIVPVVKKSGTIRICADFKVTINRFLAIEQYPLPRIDDLFAKMAESGAPTMFSQLDLVDAFFQLPVSEASKQILVINTPFGLFRYNRLPFGVSPAPLIFQRTMDTILQGLQGVLVFEDDVLIIGQNAHSHDTNLRAVLARLAENGAKLSLPKCLFKATTVQFLGYSLSAIGITPDNKTDAITSMPAPTNVSKVRTFIGMVQYFAKIIPNLAAMCKPLYHLLHATTAWCWDEQCDRSFAAIKKSLSSQPILTHYDSTRKLVLASDASNDGLGVVIAHLGDNEQLLPIAH